MPEKARKQITSRKNKRKTSLKSRKGVGVWDSFKKFLPK